MTDEEYDVVFERCVRRATRLVKEIGRKSKSDMELITTCYLVTAVMAKRLDMDGVTAAEGLRILIGDEDVGEGGVDVVAH